MTIVVETVGENPSLLKSFPKLMIHPDGLIIFALGKTDRGTVKGSLLVAGRGTYPVGHFSDRWSNFTDFTGTVTIRNE